MYQSSNLSFDNVEALRNCSSADCYNNETKTSNKSDQNVTFTEMVCIFEPPPEDYFSTCVFQITIYVMYGIIIVVALFGNGLVCYVVQSTPRMKTVTNYFMVNLAVGDILMTLFCVPFSFVSMLILKYWPFGAFMCKVVNYSQAVSVLVSAYTLLAISIDRYFVITRPLKPRLGKTAAKLVMGAVWSGAMATAAPILIVSELQKPSLWHQVCDVYICSEKWSTADQSGQYTCALLLLQFAIPLGALVYTYSRIASVVWGLQTPGEAESARDTRIQHSKRKMIKMMITVVGVFTICWLPLNLFIVLWTAHEDDEDWGRWPGMPYVWFVSHWLAMSHCCYNPIIYCYMNVKYRSGFKQALNKIFHLKHSRFGRSGQRSSFCERIQVSELVAVDGAAQRTLPRCICCRGASFAADERKCTFCDARSARSPSINVAAPVRAISLRTHSPQRN